MQLSRVISVNIFGRMLRPTTACCLVIVLGLESGLGLDLRRDFDRPNTFAVRFSSVQVGSLWLHARSKSRSVHFGSTWRLFT